MKVELVIPSRCTAKLPEDLSKPYLVAEEKMDGSRYVLYMGCDPYERNKGPNTLLSRRVSVIDGKHVDRTLNVPHITRAEYVGLEGTVLDGEIMASNFLGTNSVMNSSPALAVMKQKESGLLAYHVFDVIKFRGKDVRGLSLEKRRKILLEVIRRMNNPSVKAVEQIQGDLMDFFKRIVARGGEGIIVKDLRTGYGISWAKCKRTVDVSCIVTGFKPGNGKYAGSVGAIAISVIHEGKLIEIGFASGFDDKTRIAMSDNPDEYLGKVVDIFAQEIQKTGIPRLRHPTFYRWRDDVNAEDCTLEKIIADMKTKVRSNRAKED